MLVQYVSIWDGERVETSAIYDPNSNTVSCIETVDLGNEYNCCEREFIELPNGDEIDISELIITND